MKTNYNISAKIIKDAGNIKEHAEKNHPQVEPDKAEGDKSGENDQAADETQAAQAYAYSDHGVATEQAGTGDELTPEAAEDETQSLIGRRDGAVATGTKKQKAGKSSMKDLQSTSSKIVPKHK